MRGLNQGNNRGRTGPCKRSCVANDFASRVALWITTLNKVCLRAAPWGSCLSKLHLATHTHVRLDSPHLPPRPPTPVTSVRNHMIYHTDIPFSTNLIALISLLTFPTIPPACIFHAWPGMASVPLRMIATESVGKKKRKKTTQYLSHCAWSSLCNNHVYFMFQRLADAYMRTGRWVHRLADAALHILSTWRCLCLQREGHERCPAASAKSQARRSLICCECIWGEYEAGEEQLTDAG